MLSVCTLLSNKMIIFLREEASEVVIANPYNAVLENSERRQKNILQFPLQPVCFRQPSISELEKQYVIYIYSVSR